MGRPRNEELEGNLEVNRNEGYGFGNVSEAGV